MKLESIGYQYNASDIEGKRRIIGSIFPKKFQFENKKVRTADLNPLFIKISSINSLSQRTKKKTNSKKLNLSVMVGDIDLSSNQMLDFLEYFIEEMS